jgi:hypothetical protein
VTRALKTPINVMSLPMRKHNCWVGVVLIVGVPFAGGCQARRAFLPPALPPVPLAVAAGIIDANIARATDTLRAVGTVDGYFTMDGRRRHYSVDAVLFFLRPNHIRFDLKKLGDRQFLFGSNTEMYWFYDKQSDEYYCGGHDEPQDYPADMPIHPDQIADALALRPIGLDPKYEMKMDGAGRAIAQRVVDDYQQILFVVPGSGGRAVPEKEYWLDRRPPQVVRRVLFRDAEGLIELESRLDEYKSVESDGPMLPHVMLANWPEHGARMRFRVSRWTQVPQVSPGGPQFATPRECRP